MQTQQYKHPYNPNETQRRFHASPKRFKGLKGSKGSGKTRALIEEAWMLAYDHPGNCGVVCRKDYPALTRTTMAYFLEWMPPVLKLDFNQVQRKVTIQSKDPARPSTVYFVQEKEPQEFESLELGFFAIDEADECPEDTFKTLQSRLRLKNVPHYGLLAFNPPHRRHWLHRFFVDDVKRSNELSKERGLFENNTFENESNLPPGYIDQLKRIYSGDELSRYLYGEWGSMSSERAIYPDFRETLHVSHGHISSVPGIPIIRAWDFGMMAGACMGQIVDGRLNVLSCLSANNQGAEQFAPQVFSHCQIYPGSRFIDLSDPTFIGNRSQVDARSVKGIFKEKWNIQMLDGAINWQDRIGAVQYFMSQIHQGKACLQIDPRCDQLIAGFEGGYVYAENATERNASSVEDNEFTALQDCLQHMAWYARRKIIKQSFGGGITSETYDFGGIRV